jgi:aspartate/methionine/tyrosine aminotransferase
MNQEYVETFLTEVGERIALACKEFITYLVLFTRPEGGMYLFPRANIANFDSQTFTRALLSKKKVAVVPGDASGVYSEYFRLFQSMNKRDIKQGVKRIGALLEEWL